MHKGLFNNIAVAALLVPALLFMLASPAHSAKKGEKKPVPPTKEGVMNPHDQMTDEGMIRFDLCATCHAEQPDVSRAKSIKDVKLLNPEDPNKTCIECHEVMPHPGAEGVSATMSQMVAPDHLVEPSEDIVLNIKLSKKEVSTILPLHPENGKVMCATCHNPHERGLLRGRADTGADRFVRLRTPGLDICQYCHRK